MRISLNEMRGRPGGEQRLAAAPIAHACESRREQLLDQALKESFPASDPPSIAWPVGP